MNTAMTALTHRIARLGLLIGLAALVGASGPTAQANAQGARQDIVDTAVAAGSFQTLATALPPVSFWLLVAGGITYSAGIIFHLWEKLKFQNVLWHVFVVAGSILHLWAIFDCMVLSRL